MYTIETKIASKNGWMTPAEAKNWYGLYNRTGVTVHWWNTPEKAGTHDATVNYILGQAKAGNMSISYVVSDSKITNTVHPDNVAFHATKGNPTDVGIEFDPRLKAEGYKKGGWLIWQLEKRYNKKLALHPHNYWSGTQCPGTIDLKKLRYEANKWASGAYNPKPSPIPMAKLKWTKLPKPVKYKTNKQPTRLWDFNNTAWKMKEVTKYNKNHEFVAYGTCKNETLGATYLVAEDSFLEKIPNGVHEADLDKVIAPKPVPVPTPPAPEPDPIVPRPEVPPKDSDYEERIVALEQAWIAIKKFLEGIFNTKI